MEQIFSNPIALPGVVIAFLSVSITVGVIIVRITRWTKGVSILIDSATQRLDNLIEKVGTLTEDMVVVKADLAQVKSDIIDLKADMVNVKAELIEVKADIVEVKADVEGLKADMVGVKADIEGLKADMIGVKADIKTLYILLPIQGFQSQSPLQLTDHGRKISDDLSMEEWAEAHAPLLVEQVAGKDEFEFFDFCQQYVNGQFNPSDPKDIELRRVAFHRRVPRDVVIGVYAIVLRDTIIRLQSERNTNGSYWVCDAI